MRNVSFKNSICVTTLRYVQSNTIS